MKFNFSITIKLVVILLGVTTSFCFSQKLSLNVDSTVVLSNSDYFVDSDKFQILDSSIYYLSKKEQIISLFEKKQHLEKRIGILGGDKLEYLKDFVIDKNKEYLYVLFHEKVVKYNINDLSVTLNTFFIQEIYDEIFLDSDKIILTRCYNEATTNNTTPKPRVLILSSNFVQIKKIELNHDAIGLTHKPTYFIDVNYGKILYSNALSKRIEIIDLNNFDVLILGDSLNLNKELNSLPFSTNIIAGMNPKMMIQDLVSFPKN